MTKCIKCGSYAFNLCKEDIDQGGFCDVHYWQDQAQKARADEREACAKVCDVLAVHPEYASSITKLAAQAIRNRGQA